MYSKFRGSLILVFLASLLFASVSGAENYIPRLPGAKIANKAMVDGVLKPVGSCNRWADPTLDGDPTKQPFEKSCIGQNITRENFKVKVSFEPKQPVRDRHGNPWTAGSITVEGPPALPLCNTNVVTDQNEDTCNEIVCPPGTSANPNPNHCTTVAKLEDDDGNEIDVAANLPKFAYSVLGAPIYYNATSASSVPLYFKGSSQTYPTSGVVQTQKISGGVPVVSKCRDADGVAVASSTQPTTSSMTCSTGTPITNEDGTLIAQGLPVMENIIYPSPSKVTTVGSLSVTCTAGTTQTYAANKLVTDANCNPQKDLNHPDCVHLANPSSACTKYVVGGGSIYDTSGNLSRSQGEQIRAVAGPSVIRDVSGSLYSLVFNENDINLQNNIMTLGARSVDISRDTEILIYPETLVSFVLKYEGNKACVYAHERHPEEKFRVEGEYPVSLNEVYGVISNTDMDPSAQPRRGVRSYSLSSTAHCVDAPPPTVNTTPLSWGSMVSPICTNYDSSNSRFRWPSGRNRAFTGVVVECIEDTMMSLFYPTASNPNAPATVFSSMQDKIKGVIRALMVLYIIFFGYMLIIGKDAPKRDQWMWVGLKIALITYFAIGTGMTDLLPQMLKVSKSLSVIVMEAGLGIVNDPRITAAQSAAAAAHDDALLKRAAANAATLTNSQTANSLIANQEAIDNLTSQLATALTDKNLTESVLNGHTALLNTARADLANLNADLNTLKGTIASAIETAQNQFIQNNQNKEYVNTGAGSYKAPSFCTNIKVELWGGGSAGSAAAGCTDACDWSGAAGGHAIGTFNVSAGTSYSLTVGSGGNTIGAAGEQTYFSGAGELYANGGAGRVGGTVGGTASTAGASAAGGAGIPSTYISVAGTAAVGSTAQAASDCPHAGSAQGITKAPFGGGGCSGDDTGSNNGSWGKGGDGKVKVTCTNFNFTNFSNIDISDPAQVAFKDDLQANSDRLHVLQTSNPQSIAEKQAEVARLEGQLVEVTNEYNAKVVAYNDINAQLSAQLLEKSRIGTLQTAQNSSLAALIAAAEAAEALDRQLAQSLQNIVSISANSGYSYCDFRSHTYPNGKEYLKLWDMIDCKFSKYLGIGDNDRYTDAPQVLYVALLAPISVSFGIPIFLFSIIFTCIVIMIIARAVHMYIMAFIGLLMLIYISPLVIPSVLFKFTEGMFKNWLQQLMAFWLQPVILFGFLAFMFACIDSVMFGGNHVFSPNNKIVNDHTSDTNPFGEITTTNKNCGEGDSKCKDPSAVGYIYQSSPILKDRWPTQAMYLTKIWQVDFGPDDGKAMFIGLTKLMFMSFIIYSVLAMAETMSARLVNAMAEKGAGTLSVAPVASPASIVGAVAKGATGAKDLAYQGYRGVKGGVHAAKHYKSTGKAIKRAVLNFAPIRAGRAVVRGGKFLGQQVNNALDKRSAAKAAEANRQMATSANAAGAHQQMVAKANADDRAVFNAKSGGQSTGGQSEAAKSSPVTQAARAAHRQMVEGKTIIRPGINTPPEGKS